MTDMLEMLSFSTFVTDFEKSVEDLTIKFKDNVRLDGRVKIILIQADIKRVIGQKKVKFNRNSFTFFFSIQCSLIKHLPLYVKHLVVVVV